MQKILVIIFCILSTVSVYGQDTTRLVGEVTYITSQNIYIRFDNTDKIEIGDTIKTRLNNNNEPCLVVKHKSTTSCVCVNIGDCNLKVNDRIAVTKIERKEQEELSEEPGHVSSEEKRTIQFATKTLGKSNRKNRDVSSIRGRLSASSYSSISDYKDNRHRLMYRFSLNAKRINHSKISLESYINFRQNFIDDLSGFRNERNFLRVYNLSVNYAIDSTSSVTLGRKINYKISSLGAIDGLQAEKYFGNIYAGVIAGFRPDILDFDFNPNLFEYGGYLGFSSKTDHVRSQTTLGLLEQRNSGAIDRRYLYFQHNSQIRSKLSLFSSAELDLYSHVNHVSRSELNLTSLFISLRYRLNKKIDLNLSYDTRKRIIFYETLKTQIERLLEDNEARQGIRGRINIKPFNYFRIGISYAKRFQTNLQNKSDNINGYLSLSKIPLTGGRIYLNFNLNNSNYLESQIYSIRYSRDIGEKVDTDIYFRSISYSYFSKEIQRGQHFYGANVSYRINRDWYLSILGEIATREAGNDVRVNTKILRRFGNK